MKTFLQRNQITVPPSHNAISIKLEDHTWVSVDENETETLRVETPDNNICFALAPGTYIVQTDGKIKSLISETLDLFFEESTVSQGLSCILKLSSDAPDQHIVDGIGEIPADGTSFCTITISKLTLDGTLLTDEEHQDELFLRSTGGLIMDNAGENHIRSLHLQSGQAAFRLISEASPKIVTVTIFGRAPNLTKAEIQIEFV